MLRKTPIFEMMKIPPFLVKGDTVAIVCTARKITAEELQAALGFLTDCGLVPLLGKTIGKADHQFGGTDAERAEDFQKMLDNPEVKAIWCARGGYGTVRMIDYIDFSRFIKNPKWIIGYSDPTVLHCHIHNLGVATIHGQMCLEIEKKTEATRETLKDALFGNMNLIEVSSANKLNKIGVAKGKLIGGNLSVISSLLGSASAINTTGKILFLEDLDEYLYHIDRVMMNLKRNGILDNLAGLIIGGMTDMNDNTIPFGKTAEETIAHIVGDFHYPVCYGFPTGHGIDNRALIFGAETTLTVSENNITLEHF